MPLIRVLLFPWKKSGQYRIIRYRLDMVNMIFHADHAGNTCQLLTECILRGSYPCGGKLARKLMI